jgi:hypothetical protein
MKLWLDRYRNNPFKRTRAFGGGSPPPVAPVNTVGQNANTAKASADAAEEEKKRLAKERGVAGTILTGPQGSAPITTGRKTLLGE